MAMSELDAYNICLRAVGQARIASIANTYDPDVAEISSHMADAKREILTNGWKFNTDKVTLSVDAISGKIPVAQSLDGETNYMKYYLPKSSLYDRYTDRGGYLFDPETSTYPTDTIENVWVVVDISDWNSLPDEAREAIAYKAAVSFLIQLKGAVPEVSYWESKAYEYLCRLEAKYQNDYGQTNGIARLLADFNS